MKDLVLRIKTLSTSFVTYAVLISTVLTQYSDELPAAWQAWAVKAVAWLATAVVIVRKVTQVVDSDVGLLPVAYPTPVKSIDPPA